MHRLIAELRRKFAVWIFPQFGEDWQGLRERLAQETALKIEAQDHARDLAARLEKISQELAESRKETTHAVMLVGDWFAQQMFGRKIFAASPISTNPRWRPNW